jgi:hypothetical protein
MAHISRSHWPLDYVLQVLEFPDAWWDAALRPPASVAPRQLDACRAWGAGQLGSSGVRALRVPSVFVTIGPCAENVVLNLDHPEVQAGLAVLEQLPLEWDARWFV